MKRIDRYILSRYLITFFFCILLFTLIAVVIDASEKTEDFSRSGLSFTQLVTDYYFGFIPRIDAMLFPLFVFISVIFFTSRMAGRTEIIAILSSGVSFRRFLLPYWIGGFFLAGLLWLANQYVVPVANRKWADFEKKYVDVNMAPNPQNTTYKQHIYFRVDSASYANIKGYDTISRSGSNLSISSFKDGKMTYNLRAMSFRWDTASNKWQLNNVVERRFKDIREEVTYSAMRIMNYSFKPIDLRRDTYLKDQMTTPELDAFIELEKMRGSEMLGTLLMERYNRDAVPVSVLILTLIGAILSSRKVRGGSGFHLALGVLISVGYILFSRFTHVFASKSDLPPLLAAWTPNLLFGLLALYLYQKAPK